jgi:ATP-dependent helicase HrpB
MLPIEKHLSKIKQNLKNYQSLVLSAEPGAGKSTCVPQSLLDSSYLAGKKIIMLQPRRVAAIAVASRIAELTGTSLGSQIGYQVRFNRKISSNTRIEVVTEGILLRKIQSDPFLEDYGLIIFDEFHERSINSDFCLALCKEIQTDVRPDLRLLVMSATLKAGPISGFLENCPTLACEGRSFPIEIEHRRCDYASAVEANVVQAIKNVLQGSCAPMGILVFLPGAGEINRAIDLAHDIPGIEKFDLFPLFGSMPFAEQQKILIPAEKPRIIFSTNIAETSLTIEGIDLVIDSGWCRRLYQNENTGLDELRLERISLASATQRSGRAGRLGPGKAIRIWEKAEETQFLQEEIPEIQRADLTSVLLELFNWGCNKPEEFGWFQAPEAKQLELSVRLLKLLRAIDSKSLITETGKQMVRLPLHPRLARMLQYCSRFGLMEEASLIAAFISERDFVFPGQNLSELVAGDSDILFRLGILQNEGSNFPVEVNRGLIRRIKKAASQLKATFAESGKFTGSRQEAEEFLAKGLLVGFPDRVAVKTSSGDFPMYKMQDGRGFRLGKNSIVKGARYIIALQLDSKTQGTQSCGVIFQAQKINCDWLADELPEECAEKRGVYFNSAVKSVEIQIVAKFGAILLKRCKAPPLPQDRTLIEKLLLEQAVENYGAVFKLSEKDCVQFLFRVKLINKYPEIMSCPVLDQDWFKSVLEQIITGCYCFSELQKFDFRDFFFQEIGFQNKSKFDSLVPERITVPSGSNIQLNYQEDGPPILPVKLQEMFGLQETPKIISGKQPILIHLLSPAGRPLQITQDLEHFWENGYHEIAKEMRGRYPKHPWPDNPKTAQPFRGTKKQQKAKGQNP